MEELQSHLTALVIKFQTQDYVIIQIELKIMYICITQVTCDTSENNQHSSLTNYTNYEHLFLVTVYQITYCTHDICEYQKQYNRAAIMKDQLNIEF
jgi:hypothetical protein